MYGTNKLQIKVGDGEQLGKPQLNPCQARPTGYSPSTLQHWVRRYKATGGVAPLKSSGRKRLLDHSAATAAHGMMYARWWAWRGQGGGAWARVSATTVYHCMHFLCYVTMDQQAVCGFIIVLVLESSHLAWVVWKLLNTTFSQWLVWNVQAFWMVLIAGSG